MKKLTGTIVCALFGCRPDANVEMVQAALRVQCGQPIPLSVPRFDISCARCA